MNHWAKMLTDLPALGQRLIARTQRVALGRHSTGTDRVRRLQHALGRTPAVHATYARLAAPARAAITALAACPRGIAPDALTARYGPVRSWTQLAADPQPRSVSEQLLLLGWLLPRPATHRHPPQYLVPPELRQRLPQPLSLPAHGPAPDAAPGDPPAVRAAIAVLLAAATQPLPLRRTARTASHVTCGRASSRVTCRRACYTDRRTSATGRRLAQARSGSIAYRSGDY